MAVLEARRVIEGAQLLGDRFLDFLAGVPGAAGPQTGQRIVDLAALVIEQPAAFGATIRRGSRWKLRLAVYGIQCASSFSWLASGDGAFSGMFIGQNLAGHKHQGDEKRCCS
jgi:hypothetical protein